MNTVVEEAVVRETCAVHATNQTTMVLRENRPQGVPPRTNIFRNVADLLPRWTNVIRTIADLSRRWTTRVRNVADVVPRWTEVVRIVSDVVPRWTEGVRKLTDVVPRWTTVFRNVADVVRRWTEGVRNVADVLRPPPELICCVSGVKCVRFHANDALKAAFGMKNPCNLLNPFRSLHEENFSRAPYREPPGELRKPFLHA
jgi:hypothetical protein